ncbi:hypothetical protein ACLTEW_24385 [Gordonia lacunae]|uniref:hypothetical protein n=1 Tax=Gordonia TaxID=2053 RepID=UPI002009EA0A|nr:hypothetical protein [Gordonia terrae]UPW12006.1 hypothetical protein M1C59_25480 [Gordonia terrae]
MIHTRSLIRATGAVALTVLVAAGVAACGSSGDDDPATSSGQAPAQQWDPTDDVAPDSSTTTAEPDPSAAPPTAATTLPPDAAGVDRNDPTAVATTAVRVWFTWDTATDTSPSDAVARTAPLLSEQFRSSVLATRALKPTGQWLIWADANATVIPTLSLGTNQGAPDSPTRRYFIVNVTQTGYGPDRSQIGASVDTQAWVICVKGPDGWEVSQLEER